MIRTFKKEENGIVEISISNCVNIQIYPIIQKVTTATPTDEGDDYDTVDGEYLGFFSKVQINDFILNILDNNDLSEREKETKLNKRNYGKWCLRQKSKKDRNFYLLSSSYPYNIKLFYVSYTSPTVCGEKMLPHFIEVKTLVACTKENEHEILDIISTKSEEIFKNMKSDYMIELKKYFKPSNK